MSIASVPLQMVVEPVIKMIGGGLTVTIDDTFFVQLFASVTNTEYVIEVVGVATGFAMLVELNPAAGLQEYMNGPTPPVAVGEPPSVKLEPMQIELFGPAVAVTAVGWVMVTAFTLVHPEASVVKTEYVPAVRPVIAGVVCPVDQL